MNNEMMPPVVNQPLNQTREIIHRTNSNENRAKLGRVLVFAAVAGVATGSYMERQAGAPATDQVEITHTVEQGQTVQAILESICQNPSEADLMAAQTEVGMALGSANPANPSIHEGQVIDVTISDEHCQPK